MSKYKCLVHACVSTILQGVRCFLFESLCDINTMRPSDAYMRRFIIGSDNGLSPGRCQAIIWINVGILLIRTLETNFSEILSEIHTFLFKKMHLKMSSGKCHPFCLGLKCVINQSWRECNHKTSNWPYQGHQVLYLVPRTTDRLSSRWSIT